MISVGIDVSKDKSTVCVLKPYGEVVLSPFEVAHDEHAVSKFISELHAMDDELRIVMEATGAYHLPLVQGLRVAVFFVSVINPLAVAHSILIAIWHVLSGNEYRELGVEHYNNFNRERKINSHLKKLYELGWEPDRITESIA